MTHKYRKISKKDVIELFKEKTVVNRADITKKYNCSVYSVRQHIDDLMDEQIIRATSYGYKLKTN
jgi:predicted ArsR family transcriptional regulator